MLLTKMQTNIKEWCVPLEIVGKESGEYFLKFTIWLKEVRWTHSLILFWASMLARRDYTLDENKTRIFLFAIKLF